ncbi:PucR family transcriptional regulator [Rhodococcus opacus]|uniref:PucR family transcriptional regulator n=1 Tax=Rhodococcus opacus TaxID=37919 RepID=UPI0016043AC2|nr:helix-turn-helix domain-containing protein [Rhodococcus opacus]QZS52604.1 helix-turn-helix domain-containing protein [Rhodococcus opacus]
MAVDLLADLDTLSTTISAKVSKLQPPPASLDATAYLDVLQRSTSVNVGAFLSTLAYGVPADSVDPPVDALELVDHIACNPEGLPTLLRIYRLGAAETWQQFAANLGERIDDAATLATLVLVAGEHLNTYADHVVECLSERWGERSREAVRSGRRREAALRALLAGEDVDADALEYPLDRYHIAIAIRRCADTRPDSPTRWGDTVRRRFPGAPWIDLEGYDGTQLLWISPSTPPEHELLQRLGAAAGPGQLVAVSDVAAGREGFAAVAREARDTLHVLERLHPTGGVATFRQVALLVTLLAEPDRARRFADVILGPLSARTDDAERMRTTLRAYFGCGGSKIAASSVLHLHEKTVAYRLRRATKLLGVSIDEHRLDLEAALSVFAALT